jgi:putative SOS response-associated peptidase YedK
MCGRYASYRYDRDIADRFGANLIATEGARVPSWNLAPTQRVRAVLDEAEDGQLQRQLTALRWGLIPPWAKDPAIGNRMINARVESVLDKPAYRSAACRKRCIVPADGYYEWQKTSSGRKQPYYLHDPAGAMLAFAGLYEFWRDPEVAEDDPHRWIRSVTIITTRATDATGHIHDRSPLILPRELEDRWLDPTLTDRDTVQDLLAAVPDPALMPYPVSTRVNKPSSDDADLITPIEQPTS